MIALRPVFGSIWGALAATLSASCCVLPMALLAMGFTSLGPFAVLMRYRPLTLGFSVLMLAAAFFVVYRPRAELACREGRCTEASLRRQRAVVWLSAALMLAFFVFSSLPIQMSAGG